jgi:phage FluMu protein Com
VLNYEADSLMLDCPKAKILNQIVIETEQKIKLLRNLKESIQKSSNGKQSGGETEQ